eukprot:TRINITY_DN42396_c0_g1_i1.p1 TRINITY_DN42396_c0_g1~~TRINITY_DN42396_c0_g1_i1.p1  ORF type:complete len:456 (+),score=102.06 TRINITY_DN42396_c0_g1_i1:92-1369(+)
MGKAGKKRSTASSAGGGGAAGGGAAGARRKGKPVTRGSTNHGSKHGFSRREAPAEGRQARRDERMQMKRAAQPQKRKHGGEGELADTRQRLRARALEKRLERLDGVDSEMPARYALLREIAGLHAEGGRTKLAVKALQKSIELVPDDPDFARTPLLCLLMHQADTQEASTLLKGPLFAPLVPGVLKGAIAKANAAAAAAAAPAVDAAGSTFGPWHSAVTTGMYTLALLTYISVQVLEEHKGRKGRAAAAARLFSRVRAAKKQNAFVAEFVAFAPSFEPVFPQGSDLPPAESCTPAELPLLEALEYCCRRGQASVWLDTDEEVRRFLRKTLFEEDEKEGETEDDVDPPFAPLPEPTPKESQLLARWRRARKDAMDLWAEEMSTDGEGAEGGEGEGEEEEAEGSESEGGSEEASKAFDEIEKRLNVG